MPARPPSLVLACLLAACATAPAAARPGTGVGALRIGVRIMADCHGAGARNAACQPARQRSDGDHPVPAHVAALSPPIDGATGAASATITVTY
ncbi:hypothetical protein [Stenotrophomonas rhizophila]|uniref:hypothetical protein n=1 Tax=Stenotrophomonas rhizophila TaxID=216778 RepID=UPI00160C6DF2|nr:hypothetical protein [Stenotrophomonas rhizophila]